MAKESKKIQKTLTYSIVPSQSGNIEETSINQVMKNIEKLEATVKDVEKSFGGRIKTESEGFEAKMKDREIRTTEILAIFITLFTFISVNVSIFTRVENVQTAAWFILLFTACNLILLSGLFIFISRKRNYFNIIVLLISLSLLVGLLFTTRYTQWNPKLNQINTGEIIK